MKQTILLRLFIVLGGVALVGYVVLVGKSGLLPSNTVPSSAPTPNSREESPRHRPSSGQIDILNWKTYVNENYGIIFKYPDSLSILETYPIDVGELQIDLVSKNHQVGDNIYVKRKVSVSSTCLVPENVPREAWENNFQQNLAFIKLPIEDKMSEFVKAYELGTQKLFVFKQGCYECYDGWNEETQTAIPDPNTDIEQPYPGEI